MLVFFPTVRGYCKVSIYPKGFLHEMKLPNIVSYDGEVTELGTFALV